MLDIADLGYIIAVAGEYHDVGEGAAVGYFGLSADLCGDTAIDEKQQKR